MYLCNFDNMATLRSITIYYVSDFYRLYWNKSIGKVSDYMNKREVNQQMSKQSIHNTFPPSVADYLTKGTFIWYCLELEG